MMTRLKRTALLLALLIGVSGCMADDTDTDIQTTAQTVLSSTEQSTETVETSPVLTTESSIPETTTESTERTTEPLEATASEDPSETEPGLTALPAKSAGTRENPVTVGSQLDLTVESQFGEAELTFSIDSMIRGEAARARAAEENTYNLFEDDQDAVFMDITITVNRLDHINDAPLLVYDEEHFTVFNSNYKPYEDGNVLSYYDEYFHYFNEGITKTAVVAKMIPRDEATYIVFYDLVWIEVPVE